MEDTVIEKELDVVILDQVTRSKELNNRGPANESKQGSAYNDFLEFRSVVILAIATAWQNGKTSKYYKDLMDNPQKALSHYFSYEFPFENKIELKATGDNAYWESENVCDWVVNNQETLTMIIPPKPLINNAVALATFIRNYLSPISTWTSKKGSNHAQK